MSMFADELPKKKIGYMSPRTVVENQAYEFYRLAPPAVMLVLVPAGLEEFSAKDVDRVTKPMDKMIDKLMDRKVDIVNWTGVPLPLLCGIEAHDALVDHMRKYTGLPAQSQLLNVIAAMKHMKMKNVVVVNKWTDQMNATLEAFLDREGISVAGVYNKSLSPSEFSKHSTNDSAEMAYHLAAKAIKEHPEADGCYIGGGAWLSQPVSEKLERDTGMTTFCNLGAFVRHSLSSVGMWKPMQGHGRLLGS